MLAIVEACKKYHNLIYGYKVTVQTDHLPLVTVMKKNICDIPNNRLKRMRIKLMDYDLNVCFVPGKHKYI